MQRPPSTNLIYVSSLINHGRKVWVANMIDKLFLPFEAKLIKAIPLEDKLMWTREKHKYYSLRSTYLFNYGTIQEGRIIIILCQYTMEEVMEN